jgi:hypothetical protein
MFHNEHYAMCKCEMKKRGVPASISIARARPTRGRKTGLALSAALSPTVNSPESAAQHYYFASLAPGNEVA